MKTSRLGILTSAGLACAALLFSQQSGGPAKPPADEQPPEVTIRTTVNVVIAPTTVLDSRGRHVQGLKPHEFRLYDNGKLQDITEDIGFQPLSLVVCIQNSYHAEPAMDTVKKMGNLLRELVAGVDGEVAIVRFNNKVETLQDFTNDADKLSIALNKIYPAGAQSRLNDAVNHAARMLRYKKDRRKVILLISETLDRSSEVRPREVATNLQFYNIDVYTVNMSRLANMLTGKPQVPRPDPIPTTARTLPAGAPRDPTTVAQNSGAPGYSAEFMPLVVEMFRGVKSIFISNPAEVYTKFTGGREFGFVNQRELERALSAIGEELHSQYLLSYSPNNKEEGGFHTIKVDVMRPDLKVTTRPGYWMAAIVNQ